MSETDEPQRPRRRPRRPAKPPAETAAETAETSAGETGAEAPAAPEAVAPARQRPRTTTPRRAAARPAEPAAEEPAGAPAEPEAAAPEAATGPPAAASEPEPVATPETPAPIPDPQPEPEPAALAPPRAGIAAVARAELAAILRSRVAGAAAVLVVVPTSIFGYLLQIDSGAPASMAQVLAWAALAMAVLVPFCAMRPVAPAFRAGAPLRDAAGATAGTWLAQLAYGLLAVTFTLVYVALLLVYQRDQVDPGAIAAGYVGLVVTLAAWVAVALLAASLAPHPLIGGGAAAALLLVLDLLLGPAAAHVVPPVSDLLGYASAAERAQAFQQGVVAVRDVVYFVSIAIGALVATAMVIAARTAEPAEA